MGPAAICPGANSAGPNRRWLGLAIGMLMNRCESGDAHNLPVSFLRAPHSMALLCLRAKGRNYFRLAGFMS